jgi:hypothetical protein
MMRLATLVLCGTVLAACSDSGRAGNFPLGWTATSTRPATSQKRLEEHSTPKADRPQKKEEKGPEPASLAEE